MSFYSFIRPFGELCIKICHPYEVIGKERLPDEGNLVVICNHLAMADVPMVAILFKDKTYFMAKKEWFNKKLRANLFLSLGGIPVDRGHADMESIKKCLKVLKNNGRLCVFPEGTRNKSGTTEIMPFHGGAGILALKTKAKVLPLCIFEKPRAFKKNYIYVGEPFDFSEFEGRLSGGELNDALTKKMFEEEVKTREQLRLWVKENRPKYFLQAEKRVQKEVVKLQKKAEKNGRKALLTAEKSSQSNMTGSAFGAEKSAMRPGDGAARKTAETTVLKTSENGESEKKGNV